MECRTREDVFRDASANPSQTFRITCLEHAMVASSDTALVSDMTMMTLRDQARERLAAKHKEFGS